MHEDILPGRAAFRCLPAPAGAQCTVQTPAPTPPPCTKSTARSWTRSPACAPAARRSRVHAAHAAQRADRAVRRRPRRRPPAGIPAAHHFLPRRRDAARVHRPRARRVAAPGAQRAARRLGRGRSVAARGRARRLRLRPAHAAPAVDGAARLFQAEPRPRPAPPSCQRWRYCAALALQAHQPMQSPPPHLKRGPVFTHRKHAPPRTLACACEVRHPRPPQSEPMLRRSASSSVP